jgi:hypothetical protein
MRRHGLTQESKCETLVGTLPHSLSPLSDEILLRLPPPRHRRCPVTPSWSPDLRTRDWGEEGDGEHENERRPPSMTCAPAPPLHVPNLPPPRPTAGHPSSRHLCPGRLWPVLLRPYTTLRSPPLRQRRFCPDPVLPTLTPSTSTPALAIMSRSATPMVPRRVESISSELGLLFYFRHRSLETLAPSNRPTSVWPTLTSYRGCAGPDRGQGSPQ